jgi:cysteinyl-tRNA synthetase
LLNLLSEKKQIIHEALCDNFNVPVAFKNLLELISRTYEYETKTRGTTFKIHLIYSISQFIAFITKSFGLVYRTEFIDYFIIDQESKSSEDTLAPYIDVISKFRDSIKQAASVEKDLSSVLKLCDVLRDEVLPELGIKLEDRGKGNVNYFIFINYNFLF